MLLRSNFFHFEKTRKPVLRTSCLLSQTVCSLTVPEKQMLLHSACFSIAPVTF